MIKKIIALIVIILAGWLLLDKNRGGQGVYEEVDNKIKNYVSKINEKRFPEIFPELVCKNADFNACTVIVPFNNCLYLPNNELLIMAYLAKNKHNILEFGTGQGKTTFTMAKNIASDGMVTTINFLSSMANEVSLDKNNDLKSGVYTLQIGLEEGDHARYHFQGTDVEHKITMMNIDSKHFDLDPSQKYDLIFIDGAHIYSYIKSDTEKAMQVLAKGGIIVWDDYSHITPDVAKYLDELAETYKLTRISGTDFVLYFNDK